tara:strand:- start:379 stop:720 length:342 start_codon:yes stop_codon:yes gene_type:complete
MNIDSRIITLALFLIVQSTGAIWWASGISSEMSRVGRLVDSKIPALEEEAKVCGTEIHNLKKLMEDMGDVKSTVKGMDVVLYRIEEMDENIKHLQTMMDKILSVSGPMQKGGA